MALPTGYTDSSLALYMIVSLGGLATTLGLTRFDMMEAVNDVAAACNVTDVASVTDLAKLRALAKVAALQVAQRQAATWYDFSADGGDYKRSQVQAQMLQMASRYRAKRATTSLTMKATPRPASAPGLDAWLGNAAEDDD